MADDEAPSPPTPIEEGKRKGGRKKNRSEFLPPPNLPYVRTRGLTTQEAVFVREYLVDLNGKAAAIRAGYAEGSSGQVAHGLLKRRPVAEAIQEVLLDKFKRLEVTAEDVIRELSYVAFSDVRGLATWDDKRVTLRPSNEFNHRDAAAISEVSQGQFGVRVKMHDKVASLALLARYFNLLPTTKIVANGGEVEVAGDTVVIYLPDNGRDVKPTTVIEHAALNGGPSSNGTGEGDH